PRLRAINAAERQLSRNPSVVTVIGPGALLDAERRYRSLRTALRDPATARQRQLDSLQSRMHRAGNGFDTLAHGLRDASGAAGQLSAGATDAADGGSQLAGGLAQARDGAAQATTALTQARSGSAQLQKGLGAAQRGSDKLQGALDAAAKDVAAGLPQLRSLASSLATGADELAALSVPATQAAAQAAALQQSLKHASAESADPVLAQAAADAERLHALLVGADLAGEIDEASMRMRTAGQTQRTFADSVERLERGLRTMSSSTAALTAGIDRLRSGAGDLTTGIGTVQRGGRQLTNGLTDLNGGATALAGGLIQLRAGGGQLAAGLDTGNGRAAAAGQELTRLQRSANALIADQHRQQRLLDQLRRQSPDAAQSGYVALAGIDGARAATHARGALVVGVERGGRVARITVVPKDRLYTTGSRATERALQKADSELTRAGLVAHVGGDAGALNSYVDVTSTRLPLTIAVVTVLSFFMLVLLLRAPLLALLSVTLNLLTVAAAYGTIALLFGGQHPPLGGPGYIDATTAYMVFVVLYGLSIDYQVFILSRVQEALTATPDDPIGAVTAGIDRTARVVTSAAAIMAIVFLVFALVGFANLAHLGPAVTVAVLLDATVVRLMLLPAALRLLGARAFWTPSCAARVLPRLAH
ncbi:MAG TPA: MMPL family transporter, partial [Baekduia sp.]|nr:MMPL family transporter [Baekduia sp.]